MKQIFFQGKKILTLLFNTKAAGLYIFLFALSIGVATFIENDFGTSAAQKVIFQAWWFELLLILFGITIVVNIFKFRMIQQKKWALLLFHSAIIIIIIGAGVTRYFGFEGMMHIRENAASNTFTSSNSYLKFRINKEGKTYEFDEPVLFASLGNNHWQQSYQVGGDLVEFEVKQFLPNPKPYITESLQGNPVIQIVISGTNGREDHYLNAGETKRIGNLLFNFTSTPLPNAINIVYDNNELIFNTNQVFTQMVMATQQRDTIYPTGHYHPLRLRSLYSDGRNNFVIADFKPQAKVVVESEDPKVKRESVSALVIDVAVNGITKETMVYGQKGAIGQPAVLAFNDLGLSISYGAKEMSLPFSIHLYKFIMERYPGTNSASSYASEVQLIDERNNERRDFRIFMNNILNYDGYRFFQSSFDRDEKGTYLSVNHDFWGSILSYIGYGLLTLGMIMVFFSKRTRFHFVMEKLKKLRAQRAALILCMLAFGLSGQLQAQNNTPSHNHSPIEIDKDHAKAFSQLIAQDFNGRMKPVHTLTREILRKVSRKESLNGMTADQVILSMFADNQGWYGVKMIKLGKHQKLLDQLGVSGSLAAYKDFFNVGGDYKLREEVRRVYGLEPVDRGTYEKELLKIDERVNIVSMVFSGRILKLIPDPKDPNHSWSANGGNNHQHEHGNDEMAERFFTSYQSALLQSAETKNTRNADNLLEELRTYQAKYGGPILPSQTQVNTEITLNQLNVFNRLIGLYFLLALVLLFFLFWSVFKPKAKLQKVHLVLLGLVIFGFVFHTVGLGMRWYVSGRAPWSNGYESMIYIAWTSTLAGVIFSRKSFGGLAATMVLAGTILFVASLSFLDPEITPLVPVLKSYWLTIHVSMEAGSYGFLMLGAIIGLINLILMIFLSASNKNRIKSIVEEMSYLSELTLIGGLFMVSVGTYLGGVWANESWGRYWGWDAKETWALVTILVYAFILHMRIIPKMTGLFAFNVATIFGLASVIMTYYGVNYYLSGLHSYATGDPVPVPTWVYIVVVSIFVITLLSWWRRRKYPVIS